MLFAHELMLRKDPSEIEDSIYFIRNPLELRFASFKILRDACFSDIVDPLKEKRDTRVVAVSTSTPNPVKEEFLETLEKALMLADELNCKLLVLRPPKAAFSEQVKKKLTEGHNLAIQYNITLCWENLFNSNRVFKNMREALTFLNEEVFFNCGISFDINRVSEKKRTISEVMENMGYIKLLRIPYVVYRRNKSNLFKLIRLLNKYEYRGVVVLYGKNTSIHEYNTAIKVLREYMTTLKSITRK